MIYRYQGKRITAFAPKGKLSGFDLLLLGYRFNVSTMWLSNLRWRWKCYRRGWDTKGGKA